MPIWRSSELVVGRPGSPSRRASARPSSSQPNSGRCSALPALRLSADGSPYDAQEPSATAHSQASVRPSSAVMAASGCSSVTSISSWETSRPAHPTQGLPGTSTATARAVSSTTSGERAVFMRPDPGSARRRASAGAPGTSSHTYTVQYIGIANGELGILSQKQKLAPTRSSTATGVTGGDPVVSRRRSRSSAASATPYRSNPTISAMITTNPAILGASASGRRSSTPPPRPPLPPPQPSAGPPAAYKAAPAAPKPEPVDRPELQDTDSSAPQEPPETAADSASGVKPPTLNSIVDDAQGQVKVITECFYSRALHSRAAPHDRHTRRNRPAGPQVKDMELLSTALPGRFGHRAPSAGGFPGWKLASGAPGTRSSFTGSGSGPVSGSGALPSRGNSAAPSRGVSAGPQGRGTAGSTSVGSTSGGGGAGAGAAGAEGVQTVLGSAAAGALQQ